jgi:hypothetical protein
MSKFNIGDLVVYKNKKIEDIYETMEIIDFNSDPKNILVLGLESGETWLATITKIKLIKKLKKN